MDARRNVDDTTFQIGDENYEVRHRDDQRGLVGLHFSSFIEGARRGVNPRARGTPNSDLTDAGAPANSEFLERELAVVVRRRDLGFVAGGNARSGTVERALRGLLALAHGTDVANRLVLSAHADEAVIRRLLEEGVNVLDLGLDLPHAEADELVEGQPRSLGSQLGAAVADALSARFTNDLNDDDIDALADAATRLVLKFRKDAPLEKIEALTAIATAAVDDAGEFKIRTLEGNDFTREQLLLKGHYTQPGRDPILNYNLAWNEISAFLRGV